MRKRLGVFINTVKAECSIHESGRMIYNAIYPSVYEDYKLDYFELERDEHLPTGYDFYLFNYHFVTMQWLSKTMLDSISAPKFCFVLEVAPNNPLRLTPDMFDAYFVLDPTLISKDKRFFTFPRVLDDYIPERPYIEPQYPVIGSFGFATIDKGFDRVITAVNEEFDDALIKFNIPVGTHVPVAMSDHLISELHKIPRKPGIDLIITQIYFTKGDLIEWCGQNTLNIFLYHRDMAGLCATTDQAISSGRPLIVSENETFRHIHDYINPYPRLSLREGIWQTQGGVLRMREAWSPDSFADRFRDVLVELNIIEVNNG